MSNYGSKIEDVVVPVVGTVENFTLPGNSITGMELSEDGKRFTVIFRQANGSLVKVTEFEGSEDWQIDQTNRRVKHIATKIVSSDEYEAAISETTNFSDFISKVMHVVGNRYNGMLFNMLFIYNKKGFVSIPAFPNFMEVEGTNPSTITLSNYNRKWLVKPEVAATTKSTNPAVASDLPF